MGEKQERESGDPGAPGAAVLRPVIKDGPQGLGNVMLLEEMTARVMIISQRAATVILVLA